MMRWTLVTALVASSGCVTPEDVSTVEQHDLHDPEPDICTSSACNSPIILTYAFHELNKLGVANAQGFRIIGLTKRVSPTVVVTYQLDIVAGRLLGRHWLGDIDGDELVGALIHLERLDGTAAPPRFDIEIQHVVSDLEYWATPPAATARLEMYKLRWSAAPFAANYAQPLCTNFNQRETPSMGPDYAVVFEADRIDPLARTVSPNLEPAWFNIGCSGHALAKLALTGHTAAGWPAAGFKTASTDRQAMLKMLSADYCGFGIPFTVSGTTVDWRDRRLYNDYNIGGVIDSLEARWNADGAYCLNVPRVIEHPSPDSAAAFPLGVEAAITQRCGRRPPTCASGDWLQFDRGYLVTANPR